MLEKQRDSLINSLVTLYSPPDAKRGVWSIAMPWTTVPVLTIRVSWWCSCIVHVEIYLFLGNPRCEPPFTISSRINKLIVLATFIAGLCGPRLQPYKGDSLGMSLTSP